MTEVAGLREWGVKAPRLSVVCVRKEGDRQKFNRLRNEWKEATGHLSSIEDIAMNYAYQQIIGMGERALRFIFEELARQPDHWFWALRAISGEDPVPQGHWGDLRAMTDDWLNWAKNTDHGVSSKVDSVVSGVEGWLRDYEPGNSRV